MRALLVISLLALMNVSFPAFAVDTFIPGDECTTLGATHMALDNAGLVVCGLVTGNGATACSMNEDGCKWKSMSSGGGCYTSYSAPLPGCLDSVGSVVNNCHLPQVGCAGNSCCLPGFTNKGSLGTWGVQYGDYHNGGGVSNFIPPNSPTFPSWSAAIIGEAFLCCQN
ncbi:MAG: hypothetical protein PHY92_01125 [Alphaproteobacteria bacterium]|nr:hypothetical protein [Alphaproteobacteria bacterium]